MCNTVCLQETTPNEERFDIPEVIPANDISLQDASWHDQTR